jgi:tetratricopeptide (TPR) repeat protein
MKRTTLLLAALLAATALSAQETKGARPVHQSTNPPVHQTRAVVVGISNYQDPAIPDLRFAHRDAQAFADWLRSPAGGSVPRDNIVVLLNEKATLGKVAMAIWSLIDQCQPSDQAVIYFSGHGDVESKTVAQPGYWLCWDSPPYAYMSGGCFNVRDLQDIISTLSQTNNARVLVISDACHAGKLAGSEAGGAQITAANFAKRYANEVKVLSCQPNEFSLEGMQWGGGRGCFSYHLTDGLYGLADRNSDATVSLLELENYIEDRVPAETAPHPQLPFVVGDKMMHLARVDAPTLANIRAVKSGSLPTLESVDQRGMEGWVLAQADSSIRELYAAFNAALEHGELMAPAGRSANDCYQRLIREPELASIHGLMTRNFAAALVDESQQVTNKLLKTDPMVVSDAWSRPFLFDHIPAYLERASDLLGERHFFYNQLKTKQCFFEAKTYRSENYPKIPLDSVIRKATLKYEEALRYDSNAAYVHMDFAHFLFWKTSNYTKALTHAQKAIELIPTCAYTYYVAAICCRFRDWPQHDQLLNRAIALDSTFLLPYQEFAAGYAEQGEGDKLVPYRNKYIEKSLALLASDPDHFPVSYRTLLGAELYRASRMKEAEETLLKSAELSKGQDIFVYQYLCFLYASLGNLEKALAAAQKTVELGPENSFHWQLLAECYNNLNMPEKRLESLERASSLVENEIEGNLIFFIAYARLIGAYIETGQNEKALEILNKTNKALPLLEEGLAGDVNFIWIYAQFAEALLVLKYEEDAKKRFQKILEVVQRPRNDYEMNMKGRAYLGLGDRAAMQRTIEEGLQQFPGNPMVYYQGACLYSLAGQQQIALQWLEQALEQGFIDTQLLWTDSDLAKLRRSPGFRVLLKKYFPDVDKD